MGPHFQKNIMTTTIKADPDYYVLSLEELDNGQVVLSRHPVIAFQVVPYDDDDERRYETRPITVNGGPPFDKQTLWTPDGMVYEHRCTPCDVETHIDCLKERHGDKLAFHVSIPLGYRRV
mgnify:CR=1